MKSRLAWLSIALFILVVSASLFAQDTASITGTVTDPSGAAVKGAQVRVSSPDRGIDHTVPTNDSGDYLVAGLPPGPVVVDVTAQGFKKFEAKGVILRVGQKARTDVTLQVGASNTVVEVEGTAVAQVETQSSDLTGTVTGKQITQLQLNGRNGSGTVEVETKSGTNGLHGNVYEFVRNDAFNARNYFQQTVPPYKKNDYGYTVGGPIWKNHTFFFWSQEWRRDRVPGQNFNLSVPSTLERQGDFTDQCPNANASSGTDPFANCPVVAGFTDGTGHTPNLNVVPGFNPSDPTIQGLLSEISPPTGGSGTDSVFVASPVQPTNWREELIRIDHNLTDKQRLTFRFIHDSWDTITAVPLWTNQGSFPTIQTAFKGPGVALVTRLNSTFSPTLLNEFVFSYTTDHIILNNVGNWKRSSFPGFVVPDIFPGNGNGILPGINLVTAAYGGG